MGDPHHHALPGVLADNIHSYSAVEAEDIVGISERANGDTPREVILSLTVVLRGSSRW